MATWEALSAESCVIDLAPSTHHERVIDRLAIVCTSEESIMTLEAAGRLHAFRLMCAMPRHLASSKIENDIALADKMAAHCALDRAALHGLYTLLSIMKLFSFASIAVTAMPHDAERASRCQSAFRHGRQHINLSRRGRNHASRDRAIIAGRRYRHTNKRQRRNKGDR